MDLLAAGLMWSTAYAGPVAGLWVRVRLVNNFNNSTINNSFSCTQRSKYCALSCRVGRPVALWTGRQESDE